MKVKKHDMKTLKKSVDILWSQIVKMRDRCCLVCGKRDGLNAHHLFSRSNNSTRFEKDNGVTLCKGHHFFLAHKFPEKFREIIRAKIGFDRYDRMYLLSKQIVKCNREYLENKIKELQIIA